MSEDKLLLLEKFKLFVKLFNLENGTKLTYQDAFSIKSVGIAFKESIEVNTKLKQQLDFDGVKLTSNKSTKRASYDLLNLPLVDKQVLDFITMYTDRSREDIALGIGRKVSTVCGAVNRLVKAKAIFNSGKVLDTITNRHVETFRKL